MDASLQRLIMQLFSKGIVSTNSLCDELRVRERMLRNYIRKANESLEGCARIENRRGEGYELVVTDENEYARRAELIRTRRNYAVPETNEERVSYLLNDLLWRNSWITLDELSQILFVSRKTISQNLHDVEDVLVRFDLTLERRSYHGIRVVGSEIDRRICLASIVAGSEGAGGLDELHVMLDDISACVSEATSDAAVKMSSIAYQNLLVHIAVAIMRIKNDSYVPLDPMSFERIRQSREFVLAERIAAEVGDKFDVVLPNEEIAYIAIHLAAKQSLDSLAANSEGNLVISEDVWTIVSEMLERVWDNFHFDLRSDLELRMNLARHVAPLTVRLRYNMSAYNPLLGEIKQRFPIAYSMALDSSTILAERYDTKLVDDEVGYIALSFALALERLQTERPKKNILVVCASGVGSARLLENCYREEFGAYVDRIVTCDVSNISKVDFADIDYVFTTVPIAEPLPVPIREVTFFLEAEEIQRMKEVLRSDRGASDGTLTSHFDERLFFPHLSFDNHDDALRFLCGEFERVEGLPAMFLPLVFKRETLAPTSFGNLVSMPHPMKAVGERTRVCVGLLEKPIKWHEGDVQAIFLVSISKKRTENLQPFYRGMASLLTSKKAIQSLLERQTYQTLSLLLSECEKNTDKE